MATFYIDPSAVVNGDGTELSPFNTWASVTWAAGNICLQKRGTTFTGGISPSASGTDALPIRLGAYGDRMLPKPKLLRSTGVNCITLNDKGRIWFDDFDISIPTTSGSGIGIEAYATNNTLVNVRFRNCDIHDCWGNGVSLFSVNVGGPVVQRIVFDRCTFTGNGGHGSIVYGAVNGVIYRRCLFDRNGQRVDTHGASSFAHRWSGGVAGLTLVSGTRYSKVLDTAFLTSLGLGGTVQAVYRIVRNAGTIKELVGNGTTTTPATGEFGFSGAGGTVYFDFGETIAPGQTVWIFIEEAKRIRYEYCEFKNTNRISIEGAGIQADDASSVVVHGCHVHDNEGPGVVLNLGTGSKVLSSIIENNALGGVYGAIASSSEASNNTIVNNGTNGVEWAFSSANCVTSNNVIQGHTNAINGPASTTAANNAIRSNTNAVAGGVTASGTVVADPLLTAGHMLTVNSPLLGAGTHLGYRRDRAGRQRPNPPSIGAYDVATLRSV